MPDLMIDTADVKAALSTLIARAEAELRPLAKAHGVARRAQEAGEPFIPTSAVDRRAQRHLLTRIDVLREAEAAMENVYERAPPAAVAQHLCRNGKVVGFLRHRITKDRQDSATRHVRAAREALLGICSELKAGENAALAEGMTKFAFAQLDEEAPPVALLAVQRYDARVRLDFALADKLREQILDAGWKVTDERHRQRLEKAEG